MSCYENRLIAAHQYLFYIAKITTKKKKKKERKLLEIQIFLQNFLQTTDMISNY